MANSWIRRMTREVACDMWHERLRVTCDTRGCVWHVTWEVACDMWHERLRVTCDTRGCVWQVTREVACDTRGCVGHVTREVACDMWHERLRVTCDTRGMTYGGFGRRRPWWRRPSQTTRPSRKTRSQCHAARQYRCWPLTSTTCTSCIAPSPIRVPRPRDGSRVTFSVTRKVTMVSGKGLP